MKIALIRRAVHAEFVIGRSDSDLQERLQARFNVLGIDPAEREKPQSRHSSTVSMGQLEVLEAPARIAWRPGRDLTEALILQDSTATILSSEGPSSGSIGFVATSRADLRLLLDDFLSRSDLRLPVRFTIPELVGFLNLEPGFRVLHAGPETCFVADPRRPSSRSARISRDHVDIGLVV